MNTSFGAPFENLLQSCLQWSPVKRPSAAQVGHASLHARHDLVRGRLLAANDTIPPCSMQILSHSFFDPMLRSAKQTSLEALERFLQFTGESAVHPPALTAPCLKQKVALPLPLPLLKAVTPMPRCLCNPAAAPASFWLRSPSITAALRFGQMKRQKSWARAGWLLSSDTLTPCSPRFQRGMELHHIVRAAGMCVGSRAIILAWKNSHEDRL